MFIFIFLRTVGQFSVKATHYFQLKIWYFIWKTFKWFSLPSIHWKSGICTRSFSRRFVSCNAMISGSNSAMTILRLVSLLLIPRVLMDRIFSVRLFDLFLWDLLVFFFLLFFLLLAIRVGWQASPTALLVHSFLGMRFGYAGCYVGAVAAVVLSLWGSFLRRGLLLIFRLLLPPLCLLHC